MMAPICFDTLQGQALAIRPDILSPAAMNELQKLCDKVPSFDNAVAMKVIEDELGAPWQQVTDPYSHTHNPPRGNERELAGPRGHPLQHSDYSIRCIIFVGVRVEQSAGH
jgi:hypothetical protein